MGMQPKTKAECDKEIAGLEKSIGVHQRALAHMKANPKNYSAGGIAAVKGDIASTKARIAELKALRRTLK